MCRSSWRRVSNLFLNVSSFFLSMIAACDCCPAIAACREAEFPPHNDPSCTKSNNYRKRGRVGRQLQEAVVWHLFELKTILSVWHPTLPFLTSGRRVHEREKQKKRPLSGPPFSKRLSGGYQR